MLDFIVYHCNDMNLTLELTLSLWLSFKSLVITRFNRQYRRTIVIDPLLSKNFTGTWRSLHRAMDDLKTYNVTLTSSFFFEGLALHCLVSSRPWEAHLFMFYSSILGVVKCCNSCIRVEWYMVRILVSFYKHCITMRVVLLCQ